MAFINHCGWGDGETALLIFAAESAAIDLEITDMTMLKTTGVKQAESSVQRYPDLPNLLCTGYTEFAAEKEAEQAGVRAYVMKPLDIVKPGRVIRKTFAP